MIKKYLNRVFIDGLSGMALGLFSTLIIGTIICQIARLFGDTAIAEYLNVMGSIAKTITGAGIGVGVACKLKASPLTTVAAAVTGMIGAFPDVLKESFVLGAPGEPLGAFIGAYVAVEIGALIAGKTKVDIIITPLGCILGGAVVSYLVGPYITIAMHWLGELVDQNVKEYPILGGMIVSVLMGIILTLPISSAAIGISMNIGGLAAGATTVGCCCHMVGFAVMSYRENKFGGLVAQGLGTSMLQVPPVLSSAILGPISAALFKMQSNPVGSGMGSSGLVGQFMAYDTMVANGTEPIIVVLEIVLMHFVLPAVLTLGIAEGMRKLNLIKHGDLKLDNV